MDFLGEACLVMTASMSQSDFGGQSKIIKKLTSPQAYEEAVDQAKLELLTY